MGGNAMKEQHYVVWDECSPIVFHSSLPLLYLLPRLKGKEYMRYKSREDALLASRSSNDAMFGEDYNKVLKIDL
jgi:hypothetical protein